MTKFFRKYSKVLLACFGVFLMIAFIVPELIRQLGTDGANTTVLRIAGKKFSLNDTRRATEQAKTLEGLTLGMLPAGVGVASTGSDHWLVSREFARRAGWIGGPTSGLALVDEVATTAVEQGLRKQYGQYARLFATQTDDGRKQIEQVKARVEERLAQAGTLGKEALAAGRGLLQMRNAYVAAPRVGEQRLLSEARRLGDTATVSLLFMGVDNKLSTDLPAREEASLVELFEKYKTKADAPGEYPFDYTLPNRVKLEWVMLDRAAIEKGVRPDPIEVQKRLAAGASSDISEPVKRRAAVEGAIRKEIADKIMGEAVIAMSSEIKQITSRLSDDTNSGGAASNLVYKALPADWGATRPRLAQLAARVPGRVKDRTGHEISEPTSFTREGAWLNAATDIAGLPGLGISQVRVGAQRAPFTQLLSIVRELISDPTTKPILALQVGVPYGEALEDASGNRFFFCVTDAAKAAPPASLDDVREKVTIDRKKYDAYQKLAGDAAAFRVVASEQGIDALAEQAKALTGGALSVQKDVQVSRSLGEQGGGGVERDPKFIEAVMDAASHIDPTVPLDQVSPGDLTVAVALPGRLGVAIARITAFTPLTIERFRQEAGGLAREMAVKSMLKLRDDPFTRERLVKRLDVKNLLPVADDEAAKEAEKARAEANKPGAASPAKDTPAKSGTAKEAPAKDAPKTP